MTMDRNEFFDKSEQPITLLEWADLTQDWEYRTILSTSYPEDMRVETVWNGFDPYWAVPARPVGDPHLFAVIMRRGSSVQELVTFEHYTDRERFHRSACEAIEQRMSVKPVPQEAT